MKQKTSITLSRDLLAAIDRLAATRGKGARGTSRSAVIERVLRIYFRRRSRRERDAAELERLNRAAARLNHEAEDVLAYQAPLTDG